MHADRSDRLCIPRKLLLAITEISNPRRVSAEASEAALIGLWSAWLTRAVYRVGLEAELPGLMDSVFRVTRAV